MEKIIYIECLVKELSIDLSTCDISKESFSDEFIKLINSINKESCH